jgi:hypothetical protein
MDPVGPSRTFNPTTTCNPRKSSKKIFLPNPPAQAFTQPMSTPGTFTLQPPSELDKESKAKKGIAKLTLLHVCVEINFKESTISPVQLHGSSP